MHRTDADCSGSTAADSGKCVLLYTNQVRGGKDDTGIDNVDGVEDKQGKQGEKQKLGPENGRLQQVVGSMQEYLCPLRAEQ